MKISDARIESALDRLEKMAEDIAEARAESDFRSDMLRTVYGAEYLQADKARAADREAAALASPAYREALDTKRAAVAKFEKLRHEKAFLERLIEVWQTDSANNRGRI